MAAARARASVVLRVAERSAEYAVVFAGVVVDFDADVDLAAVAFFL